jgi:phospholipid/cholesterol/gamma-HCH transport system substrate-binding protein
MDERGMHFPVGVMFLGTLLIGAMLAIAFDQTFLPSFNRYTIHVKFDEAPGVTSGTPVHKSGILIGRVKQVQFADDDKTVIVTAQIDADRRLYRDEVCRVTNSLMGSDTVLEFVHSTKPNLPHTPVDIREPIDGVVGSDPTRAFGELQKSLDRTVNTVESAGTELQQTLHRVNALLANNEQRIDNIMKGADETLQIVKTTMTNANDVLGDPQTRKHFKEAVDQLPGMLEKSRETAESLTGAMRLVQKNLTNLEGLTEPLGRNGEALVKRLDDGTKKLNDMVDEMLHFSRALNSPDGSVGQLVNNPELYQRVCRTLKNVEELTRQLKPILDDARVFSDKIARHPEMLGVRGAIQKNPGLK